MKLEELLSELTEWRKAGRPGQKVPKELRDRAVELLGEYKISEILKKLVINGKTFKSWQEDNHSEMRTFISLPPLKEMEFSSGNLSLKVSNGSWSVEGSLSLKDWQSAVCLLEGVK